MRQRLFICHMQAVADPKGRGASSQEGEYLQEPLRCVGILARETAPSVAADRLLISHCLLQFTNHSPGGSHAKQSIRQGGVKPRLFDTPSAFLTASLFLTSSICTSGISTVRLSKYQRAARKGEENWGLRVCRRSHV